MKSIADRLIALRADLLEEHESDYRTRSLEPFIDDLDAIIQQLGVVVPEQQPEGEPVCGNGETPRSTES
jgi:hypothetical protein